MYGVGNVGTAIAGFTSPSLAAATSRSVPFLMVAVVMLVTAAITWFVRRDAPGVDIHPTPIGDRLRAALSLRITLDEALRAAAIG